MLERLKSSYFFNLIRHKSLQNFIFLLVIQSSNVLIALISMPLLIQALGVDQFGLVNLALSVVFLANVWVTYGYNLSGPREIAINQKNKPALSEAVSRIFFSKTLFAIIACLILVILVKGSGVFAEYKSILLFSLLLLFSEATASIWFFQGLEKMAIATIANVFSKLLYLLALIGLIQYPEDARWVNFYLGISAFGVNVLLLFYIHFGLKVKLVLPKMGAIFLSWKNNFALFLSGIAANISVHGGLIILSFFVSAGVLGMYSMAERISIVLRMVPTLITQAVYPNASRLFHSNIVLFYGFVKKVYWGALGISLLISLMVFLFAPQIIGLISNNDFESSIKFLRILSFVPFMASLNIANMILVLVAGYNKLLFNSTWTFCCFMVISCVVLSYFFGGEGLAYGLLATELFIFASCSFLLKIKDAKQFNGFYQKLLSRHYST